MIKGIGTDLVDIRRVEKLITKTSYQNFAKKILSSEEINSIPLKKKSDASYLAKRFAAKEAIAKAMGTGIGKLKFQDIIISKDSKGKPIAKIRKLSNVKIHISLTDEYPYAIALAVIEENSKRKS